MNRWAAPKCMPASRVWPTTSPSTSSTRSASAAASSPGSTGANRDRLPARSRSRCSTPKNWSASSRRICEFRSTRERSSPASSTARSSTSSRHSTARRWLTGWATLYGYPIGILANARGVLFSEESQKATQFIQLANRADTPLLFLHNTTGYMVGKQYEEGGMIKHGSMMINAVSNSTVPHISLLIGASYGAGHYGMCGRAYDPRFLFAWPTSKSAVMGGAQLSGVLSIVARAAAEARGQ